MAQAPHFKDTGHNPFYDYFLYERIVLQNHFLRALKCVSNWGALGPHLIRLYKGSGLFGRSPHNPVLLLKMLLVAYLYNLSERDTERFVNENIPSRYFVDLAVDQQGPDHSTLTKLKNGLIAKGAWAELSRTFDGFLQQARDQGLEMGGIQTLDSVRTQADVNQEKDKHVKRKDKHLGIRLPAW